MKKFAALLTLLMMIGCTASFAQKHKKRKKNKSDTPTEAQLMAFKASYTKLLGDSLQIPREKRDTVAAMQVQFLLKRMKISDDKSLSKEDKEVRYGMLENDKYMHLGAILSMEELQRLEAFETRQKKRQKEMEKERQDQYNQQAEQRRQYNQRYNRGYGGYGGYNGY
ncbi:hypothetical protein GCM10027566_36210 [Arachidicoccus ginsenosidivorans]|uniref:DUF4890 domain-containing protein n=1 Tax=Arachidicoccus ginsenosidivorans TaxID=496057 RepID=A0A5B8VL95_9BACT|nr:hypothetical protein [Arachidicoccus ginsenosidivorans]QEC71801.1 hypothetical protein FSB73_09110 [Arachidicoccus ginsenosidivorans]